MTIKQRLDQDLKAALLSHDKELTTTLRGLKSSILNEEIASGKREQGLDDEAIVTLFQKEVKKRVESAELYKQGGSQDRAEAELTEKTIIEKYLPEQMSEDELKTIVEQTISEVGATDIKQMGQVIGAVRSKTKGQADGALIAKLVKEKLG